MGLYFTDVVDTARNSESEKQVQDKNGMGDIVEQAMRTADLVTKNQQELDMAIALSMFCSYLGSHRKKNVEYHDFSRAFFWIFQLMYHTQGK